MDDPMLIMVGVVVLLIAAPQIWGMIFPVPMITSEELSERLAAKEEILIVDVRTKEEFHGTDGHLPHARNIPLNQFRERLHELKPHKERTIVLMCLTTSRSPYAYRALEKAGFENIVVLQGGFSRWRSEGRPLRG